MKRAHSQPGVDLTYIKQSGESNADAGDQYIGLDRFTRVADQRWRTSSADVDRVQYAHDRNGNRTGKTNTVNSAYSEAYTYDGLNQLSSFNRNSGARTQSWDYDAVGNWDSVTTNGSAQTRTANKQNEITAVSGATTPTFDANGNMTTDETGKQYVYDAWNRLKVVKNSGGTTLKTYTYDGLNRRVAETASGTTTDLYYSAGWQVLEEAVSGTTKARYVWSPVYVDALVLRDRDADGSSGNGLEERLWVIQDGNFNVTALVNGSGTVVERFAYDPFGAMTYMNGSWTVTGSSAYGWVYLHQGGRFDATSGLYHFRMRDYSPSLGRWTTMDPIKYASLNRNLYVYKLNNAANFCDPLGLKEYKFSSTYSRGNDDKNEVNYETARISITLVVDIDDDCSNYKYGIELKYSAITAGSADTWEGAEQLHNSDEYVFKIRNAGAESELLPKIIGEDFDGSYPQPKKGTGGKMSFTRGSDKKIIGATLAGSIEYVSSSIPKGSGIASYAGGAEIVTDINHAAKGKPKEYDRYIREVVGWRIDISQSTGDVKLIKFGILEKREGTRGRPVDELLRLVDRSNHKLGGDLEKPFPTK